MENNVNFKMIISQINIIKAGSVLSGKVEKGEIRVGDTIEFEGVDGKQELEIKGIVDNDIREKVKKAGQDKNIGLLILEKNCEQIGLQEGMTIYMSEEGKEEDYFSDLFGDFEEKKIEESESRKRESLKNQATVRVIVIYSDKLESISVNGVKMEDISVIENMPIPNWFSEMEDRNGWEGLITELQKMLDDDKVRLSFEFHGPQESKYIFEECISKRGFGNNEISKDVIAKENFEEAKRKEHRGLYNEAFKDYLQAADFGELETAQFKVGEYYYAYCRGEGKIEFSLSREEAIAQAIKYYERSANQGNEDAQYCLYTIFYDGNYVEENYEEAFKWGMMAAIQGHADAEYGVAEAYQYGDGVEIDYKEAIKWYEKAAEQGLTEALIELGFDYEFGELNLEINYEKSFDYYMEAAMKEDVAGQANIASLYMKGNGTEKNEEEAIKWYKKAAEQGDYHSEYAIGQYYECEGNDIKLAIEWYRKAAEQGYVDVQMKMKNCYENGEGLEKDLTQAFEWAEKAAIQGNIKAQCYLGKCYKEGVGVKADKDKAIEWYEKAAEQGDAEAQCEVGKSYDIWASDDRILFRKYENTKEENDEKALPWYKKAAEQGYAEAQYRYGIIYCYSAFYNTEDMGLSEKIKIGNEWNKKAADNEHPYIDACLKIADHHYDYIDEHPVGRSAAMLAAAAAIPVANVITLPAAIAGTIGTRFAKKWLFVDTDDGKEMIKYYRRAAELGSEKAKERLKELEKYL